MAAHLVTHDQQAVGTAFLSTPVAGEKSLPPYSNLIEPARAWDSESLPDAIKALLAMPNFTKLRRVIFTVISYPPAFFCLSINLPATLIFIQKYL
jgi:hypothetical protein